MGEGYTYNINRRTGEPVYVETLGDEDADYDSPPSDHSPLNDPVHYDLRFCQCGALPRQVGHYHLGDIKVPIRSLAYLGLVLAHLQRTGRRYCIVGNIHQIKRPNLTTWEAHNRSERTLQRLCR